MIKISHDNINMIVYKDSKRLLIYWIIDVIYIQIHIMTHIYIKYRYRKNDRKYYLQNLRHELSFIIGIISVYVYDMYVLYELDYTYMN